LGKRGGHKQQAARNCHGELFTPSHGIKPSRQDLISFHLSVVLVIKSSGGAIPKAPPLTQTGTHDPVFVTESKTATKLLSPIQAVRVNH
jgi:hypothetical protein